MTTLTNYEKAKLEARTYTEENKKFSRFAKVYQDSNNWENCIVVKIDANDGKKTQYPQGSYRCTYDVKYCPKTQVLFATSMTPNNPESKFTTYTRKYHIGDVTFLQHGTGASRHYTDESKTELQWLNFEDAWNYATAS